MAVSLHYYDQRPRSTSGRLQWMTVWTNATIDMLLRKFKWDWLDHSCTTV